MNKLTTTLAGLALVAGASVAPAFAQGAFNDTGLGAFVFTLTSAGFTSTPQLVNYNPTVTGLGTSGTGFLTLAGTEMGTGPLYTITSLSFTQGTTSFTDTAPLLATLVPVGSGYSLASVGATPTGDQFNLTAAAVPEASTVLSFGALLALGGLAILRKKTAVKNAA